MLIRRGGSRSLTFVTIHSQNAAMLRQISTVYLLTWTLDNKVTDTNSLSLIWVQVVKNIANDLLRLTWMLTGTMFPIREMCNIWRKIFVHNCVVFFSFERSRWKYCSPIPEYGALSPRSGQAFTQSLCSEEVSQQLSTFTMWNVTDPLPDESFFLSWEGVFGLCFALSMLSECQWPHLPHLRHFESKILLTNCSGVRLVFCLGAPELA